MPDGALLDDTGEIMNYSDNIRNVFSKRLKKDDILFSLWSHFPYVDLDAEKLADATIEFQKTFDLDFIKTMPNGMYVTEDHGTEIDHSEISKGGVSKVISTPFQSVGDWSKLSLIDLTRGAFARELRSLDLIRQALPDIPILFTVFSPMTIASKLSQGRIQEQVSNPKNHPTLHQALAIIAENVARLSDAAIRIGANGVFFANQDTDRKKFGYDDFCEFVHTYDMEALAGARGGAFNVLHLHGASARFFELQQYPVDGLNWHLWETHPNARAVRNSTSKCVVGGLNRVSIANNDLAALQGQIADTLAVAEEMGNVILAPGCTIPHGFTPDTLHFIRDQIRNHKDRQLAHLANHPLNRPTSLFFGRL